MSKQKENNFAYIDGANLYKGSAELGWKLDYKRLRVWLKEKYSVGRAYIFLGLVPKHKDIYTFLQEAGFMLIFKETTCDDAGKIKGNCDADLVLQAACDAYDNIFENAIIVSSDGDYASLIKFLQRKKKLKTVLSPSKKCSILIKRTNASIIYLDSQRSKLQLKKEKTPDRDKTL